jgi:cation-transporting ATPase 13A2
VKLRRRNQKNDTHSSLVDDDIKEITAWKVSRSKFCKSLIGYIFTFGILYVICKIWKKLYIRMNLIPSNDPTGCDYFAIVDSDKKITLLAATKENFLITNSLLLGKERAWRNIETIENSKYVGPDSIYETMTTVILFKNNKYIYNQTNNEFETVRLDLSKFKLKEIREYFSRGISSLHEYNYLLNKFGVNSIHFKVKHFCSIFFELIIHPYYLYQVVSAYSWIHEGYYSFALVTCFASIIILLLSTNNSWKNYKKVLVYNSKTSSKMIRNFNFDHLPLGENRDERVTSLTDSEYIVPGDIIQISNGDSIPCDCLLLEGYCTVNEAGLTGESSLVMKTQLPNDRRMFCFENNKKSFLYQGTLIEKCESNKLDSSLTCLAISTGYNTNRGNLIQSLLFPRPSNFKLYIELLKFFLLNIIIYLFTVCFLIYFYSHSQSSENKHERWSELKLLEKLLDYLTIIIPPILPLCMTFTTFYFHARLSRKNISCISEQRMNAAGRVNVIVLDKTGTLTEEGLELYGFQTTKNTQVNDLQYLMFDDVEVNSKVLNSVHKQFWKYFALNAEHPNFINYQYDIKNNIVYYIECLATCHGIDKLKEDYLGNSIDKKIFEHLNWRQEKVENGEDDNVK